MASIYDFTVNDITGKPVKLTWTREPFDGADHVFAAGAATMVQVMVKDSKKYAATGGWGFGRFIDKLTSNK